MRDESNQTIRLPDGMEKEKAVETFLIKYLRKNDTIEAECAKLHKMSVSVHAELLSLSASIRLPQRLHA